MFSVNLELNREKIEFKQSFICLIYHLFRLYKKIMSNLVNPKEIQGNKRLRQKSKTKQSYK